LKWKIAAIVSITALVTVLIFLYFRLSSPGYGEIDSAYVITQVKQLKQLVTVRYSIQRVVGLTEPKIPLGEESLLLMVQGQALAGVDLSTIRSQDVSFGAARSVTISLPPPRVFDAFLDESQTRVWDHHVTWWTPWVPYDPDMEHRARLSALDGLRSAAISMGILGDAERNAQSAIRDFLSVLHLQTTFKVRAT
jgi:Protein of unknown function (DUF4230)